MKTVWILIAALAIVITGCTTPAAAVQPTPQVVRVEVPGPQPTPEILTQTVQVPVKVTPDSCLTALNDAEAIHQNFADWLDAMLDEDYSGANKIADQTDRLGDAYIKSSSSCRAAAESS